MNTPVQIQITSQDIIDSLPEVIKCALSEARESRNCQIDHRDSSHQDYSDHNDHSDAPWSNVA